MTLKKPAIASCVSDVRQRSSRTSRRLSQFARTLVEFMLRRLEQKKQAGGGDFALIVVAVNLHAGARLIDTLPCTVPYLPR